MNKRKNKQKYPRLKGFYKKETDRLTARYRRFLAGELYPEIRVHHVAADGTTTDARLPDNTEFFKGEK